MVRNHPIRIGIVDDHHAIRLGLAAAANSDAQTATRPIIVARSCSTLDSLLDQPKELFDVVVLDLSLADTSTPGENVRRLRNAGFPVLLFTNGDNSELIRQALAAGAHGVSRKSEDLGHTLDLIRKVADGDTIGNQDLATAIAIDVSFTSALLSDREKETLELYASGFTGLQVARRMNITANTVNTNIKRIREKYQLAGRYAPTKIELRKRAFEDGLIDL